MNILFDKSVPLPLRRSLAGHYVESSAVRGWDELNNGLLVSFAQANGFDLMITADQNMEYQQNFTGRRIALIVLGSNRWPYLLRHLEEIVKAVSEARTGSYEFIKVTLPAKRRPER